jgi:hypothetical protein
VSTSLSARIDATSLVLVGFIDLIVVQDEHTLQTELQRKDQCAGSLVPC